MKTLPQYFGSSYLINLPERKDRLDGAAAEFARVGWDFGPREIQLFPACKFADRAGFPSTGIRGAFQSHWECLRRAMTNRDSSVLIMEDDIALSSALAKLTPAIISWLETNDWDFVFFGHYQTDAVPDANARTQPEELRFKLWSGNIQGLHFYGVNSRVLPSLIAHLDRVANGIEGDQESGPMPVDGAINNFRRKNSSVRTFIAEPKLGWQRPSRSDIMPGKLDHVGTLRPLATMLRNIKHAVAAWRS